MALLFCAVACSAPEKLYHLSRQAYYRGDFKTSRRNAEEGFRRFEKRTQSEWHWKFRVLLAELQLLNGDTAQADTLLQTLPPPQFYALEPRFEMLRGYLLARRGKYVQAHRLLEQAAREASAQLDTETQSDALLYLGVSYLSQQNWDGSNQAFHQALDQARASGHDYQRTAALSNLGFVQLRREHYAAAIPFLKQAEELATQAGYPLLRSVALGNLATCYENLGNLDQASDVLKATLPARQQAGLATSLSEVYSELGAVLLRKQETEAAIGYFRKAFDAVHEDAPAQYALAAGNLAHVLADQGRLDEAARFHALGLKAVRPDDKEFLATFALTEAAIAQRRGSYEQAKTAYEKAIALGGGTPSILWQADAGLGNVYGSTGDVKNAERSYEKALNVITANRADQLTSDYKIAFLSNLIRFYQDYVALLLKNGETGRALEVADSSRASVLREDLIGKAETKQRPLLSEIQNGASKSNTVFLFYWLAPAASYVWVINGSGSKAIPLQEEAKILRDAESYRLLIEQEKRDPLAIGSPVGSRLYDELIAPAAASIPPGSRVVIVPDGALHNLNFETLIVNGPKPHYWIEDATISVAPSLGLLRAGKESISAFPSLLLLGDPVTQGTPYQRLPEAALEMRQVQRHFPGARTAVFSGDSATSAAFFGAPPDQFSTLHFATHVEANAQSPLDSAIILSPSANGFKLYARDVAETPLKVDLVTISACRGAGARALSGEGLVGFAWAFFQAGARNVVTSLWDVYDSSTPLLMDDFYANVQSGHSYGPALRLAKLKMLQSEYKRPYCWAPFQLYSRVIDVAVRP